MNISFIAKNTVSFPENAASMFPGAAMTSEGNVLLLFSSGSSFESSDCRLYQAKSSDGGDSWEISGRIYADSQINSVWSFTDYAKPTLLADGTLIAAGYGFFRDHPEMGLSDYAEKFGRFPEVRNFVLRSTDNGNSWSAPQWITHPYAGMEISGPALACKDGRLHFFAAPFTLDAKEHIGYAFESSDGGISWQQSGEFFRSGNVIPWETRAFELPSGRIVLVIWAFDVKEQKHLNNHLIWSDDNGKSWSEPIDSGLRGQASNFLCHNGELYLLQARREGDAPGLYLNKISFTESDRIQTGRDICLWNAAGMANCEGRIEAQFSGLKFGQPSVLSLPDGKYLLFFWHCQYGTYSVQAWKFSLSD